MLTVGYKDGSHKRQFSNGSTKDFILFEYLNIGFYMNNTGVESCLSMTEDELKSVVVFYQMSTSDRETLLRYHSSIPTLYKYREKILRYPELGSAVGRRFCRMFEGVVLS